MATRMPPPARRLPPGAPLPPLPPRAPTKNGRPLGHEVSRANKPTPEGATHNGKGQAVARPQQRVNNWNSRHQLILYMDIAGERVIDIANKLNMAPGSISAIKGSPLYQTQKTALLETLAGTTFENLKDLIASPRIAIKNIEVVASIRDNEMQESKDRLGAARIISREVDRVFPRTTKREETRDIRISIDAGKLARIAGTLQEIGAASSALTADDVLDITPYTDESSAPISAKSIEEFRDECIAAESADPADDEG
jgi:hypothetical protein